jgi:hypothetical protein
VPRARKVGAEGGRADVVEMAVRADFILAYFIEQEVSMSDLAKAALILAVGAVIAAFIVGGRFSIAATRQGDYAVIFVVDRFSGATRICAAAVCREVAERAGPQTKQTPPWEDYQKK